MEFASVVDAVRCAVAVQQAMPEQDELWKSPATIRVYSRMPLMHSPFFGEDIGAMMALVDLCPGALNPNSVRGWHISGILRMWAGQPDIAIEHAAAALRLSPRAPELACLLSVMGFAYLLCGRFAETVPKLPVAIQDNPKFPEPYRILAACYAHLGRLDEAREIVARLRAITPVVVPSATRLRNLEHRELYLSGLRLAAGEIT